MKTKRKYENRKRNLVFSDKSKRAAWAPSFPSNAHHLDAVPAPTPINRNRTTNKKKTFPLWFENESALILS